MVWVARTGEGLNIQKIMGQNRSKKRGREHPENNGSKQKEKEREVLRVSEEVRGGIGEKREKGVRAQVIEGSGVVLGIKFKEVILEGERDLSVGDEAGIEGQIIRQESGKVERGGETT